MSPVRCSWTGKCARQVCRRLHADRHRDRTGRATDHNDARKTAVYARSRQFLLAVALWVYGARARRHRQARLHIHGGVVVAGSIPTRLKDKQGKAKTVDLPPDKSGKQCGECRIGG